MRAQDIDTYDGMVLRREVEVIKVKYNFFFGERKGIKHLLFMNKKYTIAVYN